MFPKRTTGILKENRLCLMFLAFALLTVSLPLHSKLESACRQTGILGNYENHARGKDRRLTIKSHYPTISYFKKRKIHGGNIEHYWFPKETWLEARLQKILEFGFSEIWADCKDWPARNRFSVFSCNLAQSKSHNLCICNQYQCVYQVAFTSPVMIWHVLCDCGIDRYAA